MRGLQPTYGRGSLLLVAGDASGFFEERPPFLRAEAKYSIYQSLADHRIGALTQSTGPEELGDVLQSNPLPVYEIFIFAVPVGSARDLHFAEVNAEFAAIIVQDEAYGRHSLPGTFVAPRKYDVKSFLRAQ